MAKDDIRQIPRVIILFCYIAILFIINWFAFDSWPQFGDKGFWFYVSLLSLLIGNHLVTPYYNKPVDAIAYGVPAFIALLLINDWNAWTIMERFVFLAGIIFCLAIVIIAFTSILLKDSAVDYRKNTSEVCRFFSDYFGNPKVVYSVVLLLSLYIFHRTSSKELFLIGLAWALTVTLQPCETIYLFCKKVKEIFSTNIPSRIVGEIVAHQTPGIVLIRQKKQEHFPFATPLLINDPQSSVRVGMSLDHVGRDEGVLLRVIEIGDSIKLEGDCLKIPNLHENGVVKLRDTCLNSKKLYTDCEVKQSLTFPNSECEKIQQILEKSKELVGIVAKDTSVERLYFEVVREGDIEEGRLVETAVGKDKVLYQIIDGLTKEEVVSQKNKFGYARAQAQKIGIWKETEKKFVHAKWIPQLNAPVYLKSEEDFVPQENVVGHFPKTNFTASIKNIHELVTHNTTILGILGVGKSMLGIELVERMITEGIKVICLDLTNQYTKELSSFLSSENEKESLEKIQAEGEKDKQSVSEDPERGGSLPNLKEAIRQDLNQFIKSDQHYLKIYNPAAFLATKQDWAPSSVKTGPGQSDWERIAALWSVTPVEITRIISEMVLEIAQKHGMSEDGKAKFCLVYEEAHSLVPEWNSVASEGDKAATNGTARAILQGRKYGMGCLLITQRTANVTKTILNQCNTIFAMRSFDKTGKDFLSDYMGKEYAEKLSLLQERHAVFFGKASSCENPVMIRLNDRDKFLAAFREKHPPPDLTEPPESKEDTDPGKEPDSADDGLAGDTGDSNISIEEQLKDL